EPARALRTLQAGVDRLQPGDTLQVRAGTYREMVTFPRSGRPDARITVEAYRGEEVLVSGCDPVTGWTRDEGQVWQAPMPWTLGLGRNQAFAGGAVQLEARYPNQPAKGLEMYVAGLSPLWPTFGEFSIPAETKKEQPGRIISKLLDGQPDDWWKGALYYGIHFEGWCAQTGVVESSKSGEITVGDRTSTWWFGSAYGGGDPNTEDGRGMLVGSRHALDQPGEWAWEDNTLYLIPAASGPPQDVEAKRRQLAFDLSGGEWITIRGINVRAASVRLADSAWCAFERCHLSYISHFTLQYNIGQVAHGRDTIQSGETGIYVSGHDNSFVSCSVRFSAGAGFHLRGYHHTIHNCLIDEVSYTAHYLNAITDAVSDFPDYENFLVGGHMITYNTMRNAGRHFFNFYGNGPNTVSRTRSGMDYLATLFAHNHLYNGMLQTRDAGFITGYYCSAGTLDGLNSQVVYNVLHDDYDLSAMRWNVLGPIYLDAGTCNVDVRNNLLWAAPGALQKGLWFNTCCTDCSDQDNVFLPLFTRTSAELTADDFPNGRPFRFGHDFGRPPPLPVWPRLDRQVLPDGAPVELRDGASWSSEGVDLAHWQSVVMRFASDVKELNGDKAGRAHPRHRQATDPLVMEAVSRDGASFGVGEQWTFIRGVKDGAWIRLDKVPLGEGYERFRLVYGKITDSRAWVEVHLDAVDGPLAATVPLVRTDRPRGGSVQIYRQATAAVAAEAKGLHDVFLVFHTEDQQPVGEFEYARFERYRGAIALAKDEVRIEVRAGARDGELLGVLHPRFTGGAEAYREMVAPLEPGKGRGPLWFVVRSALGERPLGRIAWLRLERAADQQAVPGLGASPLRTAGGKPVFPAPTNRPLYKPAERFGGGAASAPPAPMAVAPRLTVAPKVDGTTAEWFAAPLKLTESWDGNLSPMAAGSAWTGYDAQALYVAVLTPGATRRGQHRWGTDDGVAVVVQDSLGAKAGPVAWVRVFPDGTTAASTTTLARAATCRASAGPKGWSAELRLPFAALGFTAKTAPLVRFNVGGYRATEKAWCLWRGTGRPLERVGEAGVLAFREEVATGAVLPKDGLAVWLDATDAATLVRDEAGRVSAWKDKSGRGRDAVQADARFRPGLVADQLLGKPALRFDEKLTTRFDLPDLSDEKIAATCFAVVSNPEPGSEVHHDERIFTASDGKGFDYQVGIALTVPGMETGGPRVVSGVFTGRWARAVRVGCFSPNYQTYFTGLMGEILVYDRALTAAETARVRAYLACKWGLP
ncbi:MAG: carbohydrate-binding protein, partial [Armatimonadetes bacterium]|nr:carbohydrate-binding protein [Armatimonadota bacterium]